MRRLVLLLALVLASFGIMVPAASAQAEKVTVVPGMKLDIGRDGYGCTLGAVGTDKFGNLIGISAAHCLGQGQQVFFPGRRDLGPIGVTTFSYPNGGAIGSEPDYSVVKYDAAKVNVSPQGQGIRVDRNGPRPAFGTWICKRGSTTGNTCGVATYNPPSGNIAGYIFVLPGDSGGPLVYGTTWAGIVSRIDFELRGPFSFAAADKILADLGPRNIPGSGFVPAK